MSRLVEVFCATQRHQKTKNKKNETQTKVRMALHLSLRLDVTFVWDLTLLLCLGLCVPPFVWDLALHLCLGLSVTHLFATWRYTSVCDLAFHLCDFGRRLFTIRGFLRQTTTQGQPDPTRPISLTKPARGVLRPSARFGTTRSAGVGRSGLALAILVGLNRVGSGWPRIAV